MPSAIANKSSARMTKRYSVLRCRAISSTIFRDLADRSIFGEVLLGTWTLTMIDVDCFKCRFYHSKSEVENFRKAPLERSLDDMLCHAFCAFLIFFMAACLCFAVAIFLPPYSVFRLFSFERK